MHHPDRPETTTRLASRPRRLASLCGVVLALGAGSVALASSPAQALPAQALPAHGAMTLAVAATPSAPLSVTAGQTGVGQVTIRWTAPASVGSSPVTGYDAGFSAGEWGNGEQVASTARSDVFSHLSDGTYTFSVAALNAAGMGQRVFVPVTVRTAPQAPTEGISRRLVTAGAHVTITGRGTPGARLTLDRALPGHSYRPIGAITVASNGRYSRTITVVHTATYRTRGATGLVSTPHKVLVRNTVSLTATRKAFRTYTLSGRVYPAQTSQLVKVSYRYGSHYSTLASVRTDRNGRWSFTHRYNFSKTYAFRVSSAATTLNRSKATTLNVAVK